MNILIVEKDMILGKLIQQYLSYMDINNQFVDSYGQAISKVESNFYQCILLGVSLNFNGAIAFLKVINKNPGRTGILIMSPKSIKMAVPMLLDLGADDYLIKPFEMFDLLTRITAITKWKTYGKTGLA